MSNSLDITGVFSRALRIYRDDWGILLLGAFTIFGIPAVISTLIGVGLLDPLFFVVSVFLYATGGFWYRAFTTRLIMHTREGGPIQRGRVVRETFEGFPRVSTVGFLAWFGTIIGLILFVVPGLIFGTRRSPAISVAVVEGKGAFYGRRFRDPEHSALRRSRDLVKGTGNSFEVFAVIAAKNTVYATLAGLIPFLAVIFIFAVPWGSLATSLCYFELVGIEQAQAAGGGVAIEARAAPALALMPAAPGPDSQWRPLPADPPPR